MLMQISLVLVILYSDKVPQIKITVMIFILVLEDHHAILYSITTTVTHIIPNSVQGFPFPISFLTVTVHCLWNRVILLKSGI